MLTLKAETNIIPAVVTPLSEVSTDVAFYLMYVGPLQSGTTTVVSATALTLASGTLGSETSTTEKDGGADGVYAFSTYTTMGSLVDAINATPNWRAVLWGSIRGDLTASSRLTARSATQANRILVPHYLTTTVIADETYYKMGLSVSRENLQGRSDSGYRNAITAINGIYTDAGVEAILVVTSCNDLTKVETEIWRNSTALASGTAFQFDKDDWGELALYGLPNERLNVQLRAPTTTFTSPRLQVQGFHHLISGVPRMGTISEQ